MAILVRTDLERQFEYRNKNVKSKIGNKKQQVFFKVMVDDFTLEDALVSARNDRTILMLEYVGSEQFIQSSNLDFSNVYIGIKHEVGNNVTEEDIEKLANSVPNGVVILVKVPDDFSNMEFIFNMSSKFSNVRFCGGHMFCFDDCKVGCCGRDILKAKDIKFDESDYIKSGCCCSLPTFDIADVSLEVSLKSERSSNSSKSKSKSTSGKKMNLFKDILVLGGADNFNGF